MTISEHYTASTRDGKRCLLEPRHACWLWTRLRRNFPNALACVLMHDHIHLVARPGERARLVRILAAFTVRFGVRFDVTVQPAHTTQITMRAIRYAHVNPVRGGLVDDPWKWRWSTLRDLVGAAHPVWTSIDAVAAAIAMPPSRVILAVSTDADVRATPPQRVPVRAATAAGLKAAVAAVLRCAEDDVATRKDGRRLVVQAHHAIGQTGTRELAEALGSSVRTIRRDRAGRHDALDAVLLCLADPRLCHEAAPNPRPFRRDAPQRQAHRP
jgi:hypothetical protein